MLFDSIQFAVFLPIVFLLYWVLPARLRPLLLLLASCYFYISFIPQYIVVLFYLITVDYTLARLIENSRGKERHFYFILSLVSTIGTLFIFKYFNFFEGNVAEIASLFGWNYGLPLLSLALPLGLSFHTFQSLAYVIEVYRKNYKAERNYLTYSLYVMFFPQLVAGPIERPAQLLPQLKTPQEFRYDQVVSGMRIMLWGFFKKLVIGNRLAVLVDFIFAHLSTSDGSIVLLAVFAFSFELYADFSGYTDIAIGAARMFGIELIQNFKQPYFSRSISELWRRWHISLSSWFRDYVYIPLGGNREGLARQCLYTLIVFLLMGVWHGAAWHFIFMGLLFGFYICVGLWTRAWRDKAAAFIGVPNLVRSGMQILITFTLTTIAWIFFRADSLSQVYQVAIKLLTDWGGGSFPYLRCYDCAASFIGLGREQLLVVGLSIGFMMVYEYFVERGYPPTLWHYRAVRWTTYYAILLWILYFGYLVPQTFIYFQF